MKFQISKQFKYDIQQCIPHYYQATGTCEPPPNDVTVCQKNSACPSPTVTMIMVMACDVEEACKNIKNQIPNFKIDKMVMFTKPAMKKDSNKQKQQDPTCNVDVTPTPETCVQCCDLLPKEESSLSSLSSSSHSSHSLSSPILSPYIEHISLIGPDTLLPSSSSSERSSSSVASSPTETGDFIYYGSGEIIVSVNSPVDSDDAGNLVQNIIFTETILNPVIGQIFIPVQALPLPQTVQSVQTSCCEALFTLILELKHTLNQIVPFADFLQTNNATLPGILQIGSLTSDFIKLSYSLRNNQWRGNLHYEGQSALGSFNESWDILIQFSCLQKFWQWALTVANIQPSRRSLSRMVVYFQKQDVCPTADTFFGFRFAFDTTQLTTTPASAQPVVLNDEAGFFRNLQMVFSIVPQDIGSGSNQLPVDNSAAYDASIVTSGGT